MHLYARWLAYFQGVVDSQEACCLCRQGPKFSLLKLCCCFEAQIFGYLWHKEEMSSFCSENQKAKMLYALKTKGRQMHRENAPFPEHFNICCQTCNILNFRKMIFLLKQNIFQIFQLYYSLHMYSSNVLINWYSITELRINCIYNIKVVLVWFLSIHYWYASENFFGWLFLSLFF